MLLGLTVFLGFHTLLGILPGMDPGLPEYMSMTELFVVPPGSCEVTGIAVRTTSPTTRPGISQRWKWDLHAS